MLLTRAVSPSPTGEKFLLYCRLILPALNLRTPELSAPRPSDFKNLINRIVSKIFLPKARILVTRGRITHEHAPVSG